MQRHHLFIVTLLFIFSCQEKKQIQRDTLHAIPIDAALIFVIDDIESSMESINNNNIWRAFQEEAIINNDLNQIIDLNRSLNEYASTLPITNPIFFSLHPTGSESLGWLSITSTKNQNNKIQLLELALENFVEVKTSNYSNTLINQVLLKHQSFYYSITQGLLITSTEKILVEDAIRQLKTEVNLTQNTAFNSLNKTSNKSDDFNLYISTKNFDKISAGFMLNPSGFNEYAEWMQWDLELTNKGALFSGMSIGYDSLAQSLTAFESNEGHKVLATTSLPNNTAIFISKCFENFKQYNRKRLKNLIKNHQEISYQKLINQFNKNVIETFESWIDNEFTFFMVKNGELFSNALSVHIANDEITNNYLNSNANSIINYRQFDIYDWPELSGFYPVLGYTNISQNAYAVTIGEQLIISGSLALIKGLINDYLAEKTLVKSKKYNKCIDELDNKSNILIYLQNPAILELSNHFFKSDFIEFINSNKSSLSKLGAIAVQFNTKGNHCYSNAYLLTQKEEFTNAKTIWSQQIEHEVSSKINLVKNHYTDEQEILIQDTTGNIHLISADGKTLWTRNIPQLILGEVHQIDKYKNNKLQMLFNTKSKLYLIDRNGMDIKGFPVNLKQESTLPLSLFDYEKNRTYRILVSCGNKHYMYDKNGEIVSGWKLKKTKTDAKHSAKHFVVSNKDYIILTEENGTLHLLNRRGEQRLKIEEKIDFSDNPPQVLYGQSLADTRIIIIDKEGVQQNILFDGSVDYSLQFDYEDNIEYHNENNHQILIEENRIKVNGTNMNASFNLASKQLDFSESLIFNEQIYLSFTDKENNEAYLIVEPDQIADGFPVHGKSLAKISDIDLDGKLNFIVQGESGMLYNYSAE